jgi:hypothetical protein
MLLWMEGQSRGLRRPGTPEWHRRASRKALTVAIATCAWLRLGGAQAAPLGSWCVGLERLFGASRVTKSFNREYDSDWVGRQTTISFLASRAPQDGYSSPRLGLDYISELGLSAGGALGVDAITRSAGSDDNPNAIAFVIAPRLGYFLQPLPWLGVWPRLGVTHLVRTRDDDNTAVTLDVPISLLLADERIGLMLVPYVEAGLPEDGGDNLVEQGAMVSAGMFF